MLIPEGRVPGVHTLVSRATFDADDDVRRTNSHITNIPSTFPGVMIRFLVKTTFSDTWATRQSSPLETVVHPVRVTALVTLNAVGPGLQLRERSLMVVEAGVELRNTEESDTTRFSVFEYRRYAVFVSSFWIWAMGQKLVTVLLIIFNILLFIMGLALAGVGVWTVVDKVYVSSVIGDDLFSAASYILVIGGAIILAVSVLGFCAIRKERRLFVIVYFILLLVIFVALLLAAILAVAFKSELEESMIDAMRDSLVTGYGRDTTITRSWDRLQADLKCCGVRDSVGSAPAGQATESSRQDSWLLFKRTRWYQSAREQEIEPVNIVPESCCVYDSKVGGYIDKTKCQSWELGPPGNLKSGYNNNALFYRGCYEQAREFLTEQADILVGCAFAFAFTMIGGLVLTLMLYRLLGQQTRVIRGPH
ncbi:hypothetical protein BaRGS_00017328 [Batillaria attramentaria]|uniref:Tetraspanin n=1 Tax=Batillaria attramentaria TaxID=370345 RepID=A0ABD0KX62_9CAEN